MKQTLALSQATFGTLFDLCEPQFTYLQNGGGGEHLPPFLENDATQETWLLLLLTKALLSLSCPAAPSHSPGKKIK